MARKRKSDPGVVYEALEESEIPEMDIQIPQERITARGPDAPTAREVRRRKAKGEYRGIDSLEMRPQMPGPDVGRSNIKTKNPRMASQAEAIKERRRQRIWEDRAARGRIDRAKLYTRDGEDIGSTTSRVD